MSKGLTDKQALFVKEYLIDLNATQAAIRAGYSSQTASEQSSRLLTNVKVQAAIQKAQEKRNKRLDIDADYVLKRHIEIDEMDVADICDEHGNLLPIMEWPKAWRRTISGIDVSELLGAEDVTAIVKKIKWPDKLRNIEMLGKHIDIQAYNERKSVELNSMDVWVSQGNKNYEKR